MLSLVKITQLLSANENSTTVVCVGKLVVRLLIEFHFLKAFNDRLELKFLEGFIFTPWQRRW